MELKYVIPNMEKTFGNLEFTGEDKVIQRRINGQLTVLSRSYNLYSDVQRADDIIVILPAEAGEKNFAFEKKVKLIHPRIRAEGYKIGTRGFTNYILEADDITLLLLERGRTARQAIEMIGELIEEYGYTVSSIDGAAGAVEVSGEAGDA